MIKKFVVFLVEGKNDELEIGAILSSPRFAHYKEKYDIRYIIHHSDITTDSGSTPKNILRVLENQITDFRKHGYPVRQIRIQDIQEFVHIVDTDGAFIAPENILWGENTDFHYTDTYIITKNTDGAKGRNRKKAEILNKLSKVQQIGGVRYSIYFVSRNMEHVLFGRSDTMSGYEKREHANQFCDRCSSDPSALDNSVFLQGVMSDGTYEDSWLYIQQNNNSLLRHTNINLFLCNNVGSE